MEVELSDRRFNVAPYQPSRLIDVLSIEDINDKALSDEQIQRFAGFLLGYEVDLREVQKAINTDAKKDLIETSLNSFSRTIEELRNGNLDYFIDNAPRLDGVAVGWNMRAEETYKAELEYILTQGLEQDNWTHVHHVDVVKSLIEVITGSIYKGKGRFTTALRKEHYPISNFHCSRYGKTVYGTKIQWQLSNKELGQQILVPVHAGDRQAGIELEGAPANLQAGLRAHRERPLQPALADETPWANGVRIDVELHG